jgi:hypothetical protein
LYPLFDFFPPAAFDTIPVFSFFGSSPALFIARSGFGW